EIFFGDGLGGTSAIRARIARLGLADIQFVEDAILAGVVALVYVPVLEAPVEQILDHALVPGIGSALEAVGLKTEQFPLPAELLRDDVCEFLRRFPGCGRGPLDLLAVLIGACGEDHGFVTLHALEALDGVGSDGGVSVADMRRGVDVIYRRGEVVFAHFGFWLFLTRYA